MIDEKKVKLMTRMASYENNEGREDLKISAYYRKDYASIHMVYTIIWVTIGYGCLMLLIGFCLFDKLMESLSMSAVMTLGIGVVVGYFVVIIAYSVATHTMYSKKHQIARMRVKKYNHDLTRLLKIYEKENR